MKLMKLTISKVLDRKGLINSLKNLYANLSVLERFRMVDNLPFVDDNLWSETDHIKTILDPFCEYSYEQIPFPGNSNSSSPPWESPKYLSAKIWYNSLSKEEQEKIDILVSANMPWG